MKLYLIRHGETDWNRQMRFQGREDVPLNAAGIAQAKICGMALRDRGITSVYTSPLKRAYVTGCVIAEQIGLEPEKVHPMEELIERDLGEFSGQFVKDRKDYFALSAGDDQCGMEPFLAVQERMEEAILKIAKTGEEAVAVVSHGAAINVLLARLSDHQVGTGKTKLYNGGISVLTGDAAHGFQIELCNERPEDFS